MRDVKTLNGARRHAVTAGARPLGHPRAVPAVRPVPMAAMAGATAGTWAGVSRSRWIGGCRPDGHSAAVDDDARRC